MEKAVFCSLSVNHFRNSTQAASFFSSDFATTKPAPCWGAHGLPSLNVGFDSAASSMG